MKATLLAFGVMVALFAVPGGRLHAEKLITSLSSHQVMITSNFTGTEIVLFGSIERDAATVARRGGYDLVITVTGPRRNVVIRKKERILGIWANAESRPFSAPAYIAVSSNRPLNDVASPDLRQRLQLGLRFMRLAPQTEGAKAIAPDDPFRDAITRLKQRHGLYRQVTDGVTFLAPTLFRASFVLPADVPLGTYEVDVKLFADGTNIARATSAFEIIKVGFEQFIANAAKDHGFLYGLATTFMALMTGWFGAVVFRRD
jgi:uncharacterized protein (TIGR02186 family)